ncbi:hypothetical protein ACFL5K_00180 [Gemmatimonadota bacterium]
MKWFRKAVRWLDHNIAGFFGGTRHIKLAQGLEIVLVVLHKRLADHFRIKYPEQKGAFADSLATAVLNELFARKKAGSETAGFAGEKRSLIEDTLSSLAQDFPELCGEITLALYVRGILDEPLDKNSRALFERATRLGIFREDVNIPQPDEYLKHAVELARSSGIDSAS